MNIPIPCPELLVSQTYSLKEVEFVWFDTPCWSVLQVNRDGTKKYLVGKGENFDSVEFKEIENTELPLEILAFSKEVIKYLKNI